MKPHPEMIEGPEAWERFENAMKKIVAVPKQSMPPNPFSKKVKGKGQPSSSKRG